MPQQIFLWLCLCCCLYIQAVDSVEYIYTPADPIAVNGKKVLTLVQQKASWNEAEGICKTKFAKQGGTLARIDSAKATRLLVPLAQASGQNPWFGLYWKGVGTSAKMAWSDWSCTDFDINGYSNFGKEADIYLEAEPCFYLDRDSGQWLNEQCRNTQYFICEHLDFSNSSCGTDHVPFDVVTATFYSVPKSESSIQVCTSDCSGIQGCFLTWPSNKMCLMGVIDKAGSTYVRNRCIQGVNAAPITGYAPLGGGNCSSNTTTETVYKAMIASTTTTSVQMLTTTVTNMQTITTTEIMTTTTVRVYTTTTTTTSTVPVKETAIYQPTCTAATQTMVVPTTVTEISVSIQPTTSTYVSYLECSIQASTGNSPCPSETVTKENTNYVTATLTDCPFTSCITPASVMSEDDGVNTDGNSVDTVTTTVTEISVSIQPTTSTYVSYLKCSNQPSTVNSPCPNQTVTNESINYVTSTRTDCPHTSCTTETSIPANSDDSEGINPGGNSVYTVTRTITEISVSIQPTTNTYVSYLKCSVQPSAVDAPCTSRIDTREITNYVTSTFTDCPLTSCFTTDFISSEDEDIISGGNNGFTVTTTVTEFDCPVTAPSPHTINALQTTMFDKPIIRTTTVVNTVPTTVVTSVTNCAATTTIASLLTTTETWTATPACDFVTPKQVEDAVTSSTIYATLTVTHVLETRTLETGTDTACSRKVINETAVGQDIKEIQESIVVELKVPTANLSSTRRKKESVDDDRMTARIPGMFACILLVCIFGVIILIDLPFLVKEIRHHVKKNIK